MIYYCRSTENYSTSLLHQLPEGMTLVPWKQSGGSVVKEDRNVRWMKTPSSTYWKRASHRDDSNKGNVATGSTASTSSSMEVLSTDFPVGATVEIEVMDNTHSSNNSNNSNKQHVHYIAKVVSNRITVGESRGNTIEEHSEISYNEDGVAHLIVGSIFYMDIETSESMEIVTAGRDSQHKKKKTSSKKKTKAKNKAKKKKETPPPLYVTRKLKMVIIEESDRDDLETLMSYIYPVPNDALVARSVGNGRSGTNNSTEDTVTELNTVSAGIASSLLFHHPVNYPTNTHMYLRPNPLGFLQNGAPYYQDDEQAFNQRQQQPDISASGSFASLSSPNGNSDDNSDGSSGAIVLPVGYTKLGHPLYMPEEGWLPSPVGYTTQGIPFYSVYEIIRDKHYHGRVKLTPLPALNLLEEQKRMEQLLVQNKLNSEKLILEKEQNEEVLRNKMMVLQQEMERKKIHMDLVMKSNTKNHGKNQEDGGGNKEEEEEKKLAQLRVEMKDAELQMKRLQQEQLENEKKKNQAEENLLVAETELEVVQESIQDNTEEQQGDNLDEEHRKRQQKERARELAAKEKAERDQQRVDELNKRMNAALMNNDTIGVRHLNENLKAAKKDLLKSKAKEEMMADLKNMKLKQQQEEQEQLEQEKKDREEQEEQEKREERKAEKRRTMEEEKKKRTELKKKGKEGKEKMEEDQEVVEEEEEEEEESSDGSTSEEEEEEDTKEDIGVVVEQQILSFDSTTYRETKTMTIATSGTSSNVQIFVTVTPRSVTNVFRVSDTSSLQTVDAGQQMYVDVTFDPSQFKELESSVDIEGTIHVTTMDTGRELATLKCVGFIGPAIHCQPLHKRRTWCSINKTKQIETLVTNLSNTVRQITASVSPAPTFLVLNPTITLPPKESASVVIAFAPATEQIYEGRLEVSCNGGESHLVNHRTICGNPLVLLPVPCPRVLYPGDNYGNVGLPIVLPPKKRVTIGSSGGGGGGGAEGGEGGSEDGGSGGRKKWWNMIDPSVANLTIDEGRRAAESWHTNVCRSLQQLKTSAKSSSGQEGGNGGGGGGNRVELSRLQERLNLEKRKALKMLKQLNAVQKSKEGSEKRWVTYNQACTSAKATWDHATASHGTQTIDHKRLYYSERELRTVQLEVNSASSEVVRLVHACLLQATHFSVYEKRMFCVEQVQRLKAVQETLEKEGSGDGKELMEAKVELTQVNEQYRNSDKELNTILHQLTKMDYLSFYEQHHPPQQDPSSSSSSGSKSGGGGGSSVGGGGTSNAVIHKGGRSQAGGYTMAVRSKHQSKAWRPLPPSTGASLSSPSAMNANIPHAPLWPGTTPVDLLPENNSGGGTCIDFGLMMPGRNTCRELMVENCTDVSMTVKVSNE